MSTGGLQRLSSLDAAFLEAEDADRHTSMAIASIAIFDGDPPDHEQLLAALAERLPSVPRYRQRVRRVPWDLALPAWVDDPNFDISFHVRRTALPAPGADRQLFDLMARIMGQRLDRDRPMWETWVVEGLQGGRWAIVSKVHHCMVDGVSGTELYHLLLSLSPEWTPSAVAIDQLAPAAPSLVREMVATLRDIATAPWQPVALLGSAIRHPRRAATRCAQTARGLAAMAGAVLPAPTTNLLGHVGQQRVYAATTVSLPVVKDIAHAFHVTVNDVALAAVAGGYREVLRDNAGRCDPHAVRSLVPVSVRPPGAEDELANRVSCMFADLPVRLADPVERLADIHRQLQRAKEQNEAAAGEAIVELSDHSPFGLVGPLLRTAFRLPQRTIVAVTTNVPGPRVPLYLMGRRMQRLLPYVPIAADVRSGIAILSYCDELAFGVTTDRDSGVDGRLIVRGIAADLEELQRRASAGTLLEAQTR
jgi:WS/DGAT/MGAT family acyltransferase